MNRWLHNAMGILLLIPPVFAVDPPDYTELPAETLIEKLLEPETSSHAFYELWRRADPKERQDDYWTWEETHYNPKVVPCPQADGKPTIYIVLCGFHARLDFSLPEDYKVENPQELFPPEDRARVVREWDSPLIMAYTATGKEVSPFGGNNVLEETGVLEDLNRDGWVERVDNTRYGSDKVRTVQVLEIERVKEEAEPIFRLLYNWGEDDEWTYRLVDADEDGIKEIECGPKTLTGMTPKVIYTWSADEQSYVGPKGGEGDHFRVMQLANIWDELKHFEKGLAPFPADPDFIDRAEAASMRRAEPKQKPTHSEELSKPYRYQSLKNYSNKELLAYMGEGKNLRDLEWEQKQKTESPKSFWERPPKDLALAMAEANRYPAHQKLYRLAIDDRDGKTPPETGSLSFSYASARCYSAVDMHYFLRVDPEDSYLAYARSREGGVVFYNFVHNRAAYDLRFCPLPYADARQLAQTIWWLDRVRSQARITEDFSGGGGSLSTADGNGTLVLRSEDGKPLLELNDTIWAGEVPERWSDEYDKQTFLNLSQHLISHELTQRLGNDWTRFERPENLSSLLNPEGEDSTVRKADAARLHALTRYILERFSAGQSTMSFGVLTQAIRTAGDYHMQDLAPLLRAVQKDVPAAGPPLRDYKEVRAELDVFHDMADDPVAYRKTGARRKALEAELQEIHHAQDANHPRGVRAALELAQRQIHHANDPEALHKWATSKDHGAQWALQRLSHCDAGRYAEALVWWLKNTEDHWARQVYEEMKKVDPERAAKIARELPADEKNDLTVSAFDHLAALNELPDEEQRIEGLINVLLDPESGWMERGRVLEFLVPDEHPFRYPSKKIDTALAKLLEPEMADTSVNFTLREAAVALALRGRTEHVDALFIHLNAEGNSFLSGDLLGALTHLAQQDPEQFTLQLKNWLAPHLKETNRMIEPIIWSIWALDLRELKPDLERIATSSPDDYQGHKASSHGGKVSAVDHRYHLARQIVALWNEEDVLARARLHLALCMHQKYRLSPGLYAARRFRMEAALKEVGAVLDGTEIAIADEILIEHTADLDFSKSAEAKAEWDAHVAWCSKTLRAGQ